MQRIFIYQAVKWALIYGITRAARKAAQNAGS